MAAPQAFDREKVHLNVARLKKAGETFMVVVDPELALDFKNGKNVDIGEVLKSEHVFEDPRKGLKISDAALLSVFGTSDVREVAKKIIKEGELQLTSEQRDREVEQKRKKIINIIHINAIDPSTGLPHPLQRIENALEEAKIHIDERREAEEQIEEIVKKLRPIIPIKFATKQVEILIPGNYAAKLYSTVKNYGKLLKEDWLSDGSWKVIIDMPAGLQMELMDALNSKTHGATTFKILKETSKE
jgi:ribosome maturation protein SDO1